MQSIQPTSEFDSLLRACQSSDLETVASLIQGGANPHAKNSQGKSVIDIIAESEIHEDLDREPSEKKLNYALIINSMNGNVEKIKLLLALGADVNYFDPDLQQVGQVTPLSMASGSNNLEAVKALIEAGADVNKSVNDLTPLRIACDEGHLEVVKTLIEAGANPHAKNSRGKSVIDIVTANEQIESKENRLKDSLITNSINGNVRKIKLLLALGGDVNQADSSGFTLLHNASSKGHLEVVKTLIEAGADLNAKNQNQRILKYGVILPGREESSTQKPTALAYLPFATEPLHLACQNGHLNVVETLIRAGAETQNKDHEGNFPLDIAIKNRNSQIASLLTKAIMEKVIESPSPSIGVRIETPPMAQGERQDGGGRN